MKKRTKQHDNWATPPDLLAKIKEEFGDFYDPCPLNASFDGLNTEWGKVNFINPPYNRKDKESFVRKALEESRKGKLCIMLLPVSTSTKIFHEVILPNAEMRFLCGRPHFIGVNTKGELVRNRGGQHDSMLVIFRPVKLEE